MLAMTNQKSVVFIIAILFLFVFSMTSLPNIEAAPAEEKVWNPELDVHFNWKAEENQLSPESKLPEEEETQQTVRAEYNDYGLVRSERQPVHVGEWISESVEYEQSLNLEFANLWYIEDGSSDDNACEWTFDVRKNGETVSEHTISCEDDHSDMVREAIFTSSDGFNPPTLELASGDQFSIDVTYEGWEDIVIYFDNITYDTGYQGRSAPLTFFKPDHKGARISFELVEAWPTNWNQQLRGDYIYLTTEEGKVDGRNAEVVQGKERQVGSNGTTVVSTIIIWTLEVKSLNASIMFDYAMYKYGGDPALTIDFDYVKPPDDGGGFLAGPPLHLVVLAIMAALVVSKRSRNKL